MCDIDGGEVFCSAAEQASKNTVQVKIQQPLQLAALKMGILSLMR